MNHQFSNFYLNLGDSEDCPNMQYYENSMSFSNPSQARITENSPLQTSQISEKQPQSNKWDVNEDVALMSSWFMVSEDNTHGKNKKKIVGRSTKIVRCSSSRKTRKDWYKE